MKKQKNNLAKALIFSGAFLFVIIYILEKIYLENPSLSTIQPIKILAFIILYGGAILYIRTKEKSPLKKSITYIKDSKKYICAVFLIFLVGAVLGIIFKDNLSFLDNVIKEIIQQTENLSTKELIIFIFLNNTLSSIFGIFGGIAFGIMPIISSISNGVLLGYVMNKAVTFAGIGTIWRLFPHGIFELPAIFISFGLGIKLGFSIIKLSKKRKEFKKKIYETFVALVYCVIPLLIIAAIIEGFLIGLIE